jgi:transcriptional regulator with XRE-family HTH domain
MATRERALDDARRRAERLRAELGHDLREVRIGAGLSQAVVARAARLSPAQVSRIERADLPRVALDDLIRLAAVLGLKLSARAYPAGDPIRDSAQHALLERLRSRLHPSLAWRIEVPLPISGDLRAWDGAIRGQEFVVGVEAETRLHDVQAIARRLALKKRDGGIDHMILLVSDTRHNRLALAASRELLRADLPGDTRALLRALSAAEDPGASGIVIL